MGEGVALVARLLLSLAIVFAVMIAASWLLRRTRGGLSLRKRTAVLDVVAQQSLGRSASVAVVVAGGRAMLVGVTDASVTLLAERDASELVEEQKELPPPGTGAVGAGRPTPAWTTFLETLRERTVRRT
jgi:flagellar protein FliO/FliZ